MFTARMMYVFPNVVFVLLVKLDETEGLNLIVNVHCSGLFCGQLLNPNQTNCMPAECIPDKCWVFVKRCPFGLPRCYLEIKVYVW